MKRRLFLVLMMIFSIGSAVFAGTYKNYEECCSHIWWETSTVYQTSIYKANQFEVTDDLWGGYGRHFEEIMLNFIQVPSNFNGVVTQPTLINGTDISMFCFFYKKGKLQKTIIWRFYQTDTN
jgi:hypothetical protein